MTEREHRCETCEFSVASSDGWLTCHGAPPTAHISHGGLGARGVWPEVNASEWCGMWRAKTGLPFKIVMAASFARYKAWLAGRSDNGITQNFFYVGSRHQVIGTRFAESDVLKLPGWESNPGYDEEFMELMRHATELEPENAQA